MTLGETELEPPANTRRRPPMDRWKPSRNANLRTPCSRHSFGTSMERGAAPTRRPSFLQWLTGSALLETMTSIAGGSLGPSAPACL